MYSSSLRLSTDFFAPKLAGAAASPPHSSVGFRFQPRVSASYATADTAAVRRIVSQASPYEVLGIRLGATSQEIKSAYRRLARESHPDARKDESSAEEFMRIHAAYATLSDPERRADYDREMLRRQMVAHSTAVKQSSASKFSGYTRRNWETDQCW